MNNPAILIAVLALAGCANASTMPLSQDTVQITSRAAPIRGPEGAQKVAIKQAVSGGAKVGQWSGGVVLPRGGVITGHWLG
jgi:hypothetical protein